MLMAASNEPGRKGTPCPISARRRSPSTSRRSATSSMLGEMSIPIQVCGPPSSGGTSESISPERPEPQPTSRIREGDLRSRSSSARCVMSDWMLRIREEVVYFRDSSSL